MKRFFPTSIRWSLQLWQGGLLMLVLTVCGLLAWEWQWAQATASVDAQLQRPVLHLMGRLQNRRQPPPPPQTQVGPPGRRDPARGGPPPAEPPRRDGQPPPDRPPPPEGTNERPLRTDRPGDADLQAWLNDKGEGMRYYAVLHGNSETAFVSGGALASVRQPLGDLKLAVMQPSYRKALAGQRSVRELLHRTPEGYVVILGQDLTAEIQESHRLAWNLVGLASGIWLVAFLGGGWITRRALRPIADITTTATQLAAGHMEGRINVAETETELGQLAQVLNQTFARLQNSFDQQARFTADAAHELRTPVTVLLSQTQLALSREREGKDYRDALEVCRRAGLRMQSLTESLLQLARLDANAQPIVKTPVDLAIIAAESLQWVKAGSPSMAEPKVDILFQPAGSQGDAKLLGQVLTNLIQNACQHAGSDGKIAITTGVLDGVAFAEVADTGSGISAEHLPHLFDRFYRAEQARTRSHGPAGAGLGLAIAKTIADAHGAKLTASSELGVGSVFRLEMPVTSPSA